MPGEVEGALNQARWDFAGWTDDVRASSRWATAPGGYQLVLPTGQVVTGADGKPRVWSADDLMRGLKAAEGEPGSTFEAEGMTFTVPRQPTASPAPAKASPPASGGTVSNPFAGGTTGKVVDLLAHPDRSDTGDIGGSR